MPLQLEEYVPDGLPAFFRVLREASSHQLFQPWRRRGLQRRKRRGFAFVGPTTMYALMEAAGIVDTHLLDSHRRGSSGVWTRDG